MKAAASTISRKRSLPREHYASYLEASWGFKNHWYPALFSHELAEGGLKGVVISGQEIVLRRARGAVYALQDRCAHRGVRISARPMCLTDEHLTCWYHGFSYGLQDGVLKTIVGSPNDPVIGKIRIRTYPVEERAGIIFVFVGDAEYQLVPPLTSDLPIRITDVTDPIPYILDEGLFIGGIHAAANANWRLGAENSFDPGHVLIHRDNMIVAATDSFLPLSFHPRSPESVRVIDELDGPKGFTNLYNTEEYEFITENKVVNIKSRGKSSHYVRTSFFLPCCLLVEHWPLPGWAIYGWYVPIDDQRHEYWDVAVTRCRNDEERGEAEFKYEKFIKPLHFEDFYSNDIFAREAMQEFYEHRGGWEAEQLCDLDAVVIAWRKIASRFNRGIQKPPYRADRNR
jgi:nitrite reductase/ring-hydroxylating ferredoxin subunit